MSLPDHAPRVAHGQGRRARHLLIWSCAVLLVTGVGWLVGHDVWLQQGAFGPQPHPWVAWLLRAHGAVAWGATLVGGVVWQVHAHPASRAAWRRGDRLHRAHTPLAARRPGGRTASGVLTVAALAMLLLSAVGLQYASADAHAWLSPLHWVTGIALAVALLWHWRVRRRR